MRRLSTGWLLRMLGLGALMGLGLPGSGGTGCRRPAPEAEVSRPPSPRGLADGCPALAKAARHALAGCRLGEGGLLACRGTEERRLIAAERETGPAESLRTYCRCLEEPARPARRLCVSRIARLSFPVPLRRIASPALFECLLAALPRSTPEDRPVLARAAALMAPPLRREEELLATLDARHAAEPRAAALQALWSNGRLRLLPRLQRLLAEEPALELRLSLVRGFAEGGPLGDDERARVCALLRPLLTAEQSALASAAAGTHAAACPEDGDLLLGAAEEMADRSALDLEYLTAVRAVNGFFTRRGTAVQRRRSSALLGRLARSSQLDETLREAALEHLEAVDASLALRTARYLRAELGLGRRRRPAAASSRPASSPLRERVEILLAR